MEYKMTLAGMPVYLSDYIPKIEKAELSYARSFLQRILSGKLHDIKITEEDAVLLCESEMGFDILSHHIYGLQRPKHRFLMMNRSLYNKIVETWREPPGSLEP